MIKKSIKRKNNKKGARSQLMLKTDKSAVPLSLLLVREFIENDTFKEFEHFLNLLTKPIKKRVKKLISK